MLHLQTVVPNTLELLKRIMALEYFKDYRLVGGTALALMIGHRNSIDLDFFGDRHIDDDGIRMALSHEDVRVIAASRSIFSYFINDVKVDFVNYPYAWIEAPVVADNIVFAGKKDIAAMKINAITGRGRKKDFFDMYFLLKEFSLRDILGYYRLKYADGNEFLVHKSITYFEDADQEEDPILFEEVSWEEVKTFIQETHRAFLTDNN